MDKDFLAFFHLELLSGDFYYSVHLFFQKGCKFNQLVVLDNLFPRGSNESSLMAPNIQCPSLVHQPILTSDPDQFALDVGFLFKLKALLVNEVLFKG